MKVRMAELTDLEEVVEHDIRHMNEPGYNNLNAHPFPKNYPFEKEKMILQKEAGWKTALGEEGWRRSFLLLDHNEKIVGHLNIKNPFIGMLHRAELGMGIEMHMRGRGGGKLLMAEALAFARSLDFLHWVDLSVFAHNLPAQKLYQSFGFQKLYMVQDLIRVDGQQIDDIKMTLKLK